MEKKEAARWLHCILGLDGKTNQTINWICVKITSAIEEELFLNDDFKNVLVGSNSSVNEELFLNDDF